MLLKLARLGTTRIKNEFVSYLKPKQQVKLLPAGQGKPKILYFIVAYPTFSETYMHEEISALAEHFEIKIITYRDSLAPRKLSWNFEKVIYKAPCLVYANIESIDPSFNEPRQIKFLKKIDKIIADFKPDFLHAHYFGMSLLLKKLAEKHHIPFTLRTHSMDILSEPDAKLEALSRAANSLWCKRVIAFPAFCQRLEERGLQASKIQACWPTVNFQQFHQPEKRPLTGRIMCCGPAIKKKAHNSFIDLAVLMKNEKKFQFNLYADGPTIKLTKQYNSKHGEPASIHYADPDKMNTVYLQHDWLIYTSDPGINKVGLPVAIPEAQASGLGICWQELPGRREEQLQFLGGAGFLFKSIEELPAILANPYPDDMRIKGLSAAKRTDIQGHKHLLSDIWEGKR